MILAFLKPPKSFPSPYLALRTDSKGLVSLDFVKGMPSVPEQSVPKPDALMQAMLESLESYFSGELKTFDLPLSLHASPFSLQVWRALQNIPYGATRTYQEIAHALNNPKACRAVGNANHNNPCPIIIPCHRVILKGGGLGGYGGGVAIKEWLLRHEQGYST
ncbi:Methylated-DNA--protein-cysteine methyltransferase Ogt [Helicobacter sp. NHP19-003]|uniref:Methylated-DNA--protein-cysteine methyltransferase n=1 Tax=Helicobacter gastrocanis TaxID=2849641 RepID=A0ABM7S994_9HELI|nr:methylated-DNA--[protein]-cysteine S-methyltransferase [Helicobacter sp. NHP19-003]BCZ17114.1 Methylated-DNA--protein-cysteine methyltransferase Ogt [Helicobacter sp. NHP19-003]